VPETQTQRKHTTHGRVERS